MVPSIARRRLRVALALLGGLFASEAATSHAKTSHEGWPRINGVLLMNKLDQSRPLDVRPGQDLFARTDPSYSCDGLHRNRSCASASGTVSRHGHNKLLGGHGNDTVYAGRHGDVIWGDYKPSGQPESQVDHLFGGRGDDFIFGSHGMNHIAAGSGDDYVKTHWGRGTVNCGGGNDKLYISRRARPGYRIRNCETISHRTLGY